MLPYEMAYIRHYLAMVNYSGKGHKPKFEDALIEWGKEETPKKKMTQEDWRIAAEGFAAAMGAKRRKPL